MITIGLLDEHKLKGLLVLPLALLLDILFLPINLMILIIYIFGKMKKEK